MCPAGDSGAAQRAHHPASLQRRALALIYETLLLVALLLIGSLPFVIFTRDTGWTDARPLFQVYLVALTGAYYVWQWRHGGQTLALKTWRLRIVTRNGAPLTWTHAFRRFVIALPGTLLIGAGFLWALVDREDLFLHDRLAGTKIVNHDP